MQKERWEYDNELHSILEVYSVDDWEHLTDGEQKHITDKILALFLGPQWDPVTERDMTHG